MNINEELARLCDEAKAAGLDVNDLNAYHELLAKSEPTTVELFQAATDRIADYRRGVGQSPAGREFALAATATEDAIMRFNRGMAEMKGVRRDFDFERPAGA